MLHLSTNREVKTDAVTGSKYWVAKLDKLMFTWFDIAPNTVFPFHSHESEQITYVLNGELFFEMDGETHCLKSGDCIAIPSHKAHKVWTTALAAQAVDAWSPVNTQY